jgi:ABC-2 type transport system permease protein
VTFYAGELIFKERQVRIADVSDAMPAAELGAAAGQEPGAGGRGAGLPVGRRAGRDCDPAAQGRAPVEPAAVPEGHADPACRFHPHGLIAVALQVVTNNKFIGYLLMILLMVSQVVMGVMHLDHNLSTSPACRAPRIRT